MACTEASDVWDEASEGAGYGTCTAADKEIGSGLGIFAFLLILLDLATMILFMYAAYKLIKMHGCRHPLITFFIILLNLKQLFNTVFKMYFCFEMVARIEHPGDQKPD